MSVGFLYLLTGVNSIDRAGLSSRGLDYAFESSHQSVGILRGPEDAAGSLVADPARVPPEHLLYLPDKQSWVKAGDSLWVGMYTDERKPAPSILKRPHALRGHDIELAGEKWHVPVARRFESIDPWRWECDLPMALGFADGKWVLGGPQAKYAGLWQIAVDWFTATMDDCAGRPREKLKMLVECCDAAALCLQVNYAVSRVEIGMLELFTTDNCGSILDCVIDAKAFNESLQKKAESATENG